MSIILVILLFSILLFFVQISKKALFLKNVNIVLGSYIFSLVIFTIVYFILSKPDVQIKALQYEGQYEEEYEKVYTDLESGRIEQLEDYIIDEQSFEYSGKELILEQSPDMNEWYVAFIEIKDENDGIVNVKQLHTGAYVSDIDVSGYLKPAKLKLEDEQLMFYSPEPVYLKRIAFNKEYPITQFSGDKDTALSFSGSNIGSIVTYIQVPKNVVVKNETRFETQYVEW